MSTEQGTEDSVEQWQAAIMGQVRGELAYQGVSQTQLAAQVGIGREALNAYLAGRRIMPLTTLISVALALGYTPDKLLATAGESLRSGWRPGA